MANYGFRQVRLAKAKLDQITSFINSDGFLRKGDWRSSAGLRIKVWPATDKLISDPKILKTIASSLETFLKEERIDLIIALSVSGIPLGTAISQHYQIPLLILRKTREVHGEQSFFVGEIENPLEKKALLVDDSLLSGRTIKTSLNRLRKLGFKSIRNIFVFDYYHVDGYEELIEDWAAANRIKIWFIWRFSFN